MFVNNTEQQDSIGRLLQEKITTTEIAFKQFIKFQLFDQNDIIKEKKIKTGCREITLKRFKQGRIKTCTSYMKNIQNKTDFCYIEFFYNSHKQLFTFCKSCLFTFNIFYE